MGTVPIYPFTMSIMNPAIYDLIGEGYSRNRRPDPRIQELIDRELGNHRKIVNVGAGTDFGISSALK